MKYFDFINEESFVTNEMMILIEKNIDIGYIKKTKHSVDNIYIYNYTNKCQIDWEWNDATKFCRGLILDDNNKLVARSYYKFFTLDQIEDSGCDLLPPKDLKYTISKKKDGFLGCLYFYNTTWRISTRGSFESEMAIRATAMLRNQYKDLIEHLDRTISYVFEIIYPNDLLTIVYKEEKLVMHGMFDNLTGEEISLQDNIPLWSTRSDAFELELPVENGTAWKGLEDFYSKYSYDYDEGYVVCFSDFSRVKVKFDEYKQMSRAKSSLGSPGSRRYMTNLSTGKIEEVLAANPLIATSIMGASVKKYKDIHADRLKEDKRWYYLWKKAYPDATIRELGMYFKDVKIKDASVMISLCLEDGKEETKVWKILIKEAKTVSEE